MLRGLLLRAIFEEFAICRIIIHDKNPMLHSVSFGSDRDGIVQIAGLIPAHQCDTYYRPN